LTFPDKIVKIENMTIKNILNWFLDFAIDHPCAMAFICLVIPFILLGLARVFDNTVIPKLLAVLIIAPFVILIIKDLSDKLNKNQ